MAWLSGRFISMKKKMLLCPGGHRAQGQGTGLGGGQHRLRFSPRGICVTYILTTIRGEPATPHDSLTNSIQPQGLRINTSSKTTGYYTASQSQK